MTPQTSPELATFRTFDAADLDPWIAERLSRVRYIITDLDGTMLVDAKVTVGLCMLVTFSTGESRVFDVAPPPAMPAFAALSDPKAFQDFALDHGVLTWQDGAIDLAPEYVYEHSYEYESVA